MIYVVCIYKDGESKVLQASDNVDGLSCEALADPGINETNDITEDQLIEHGKIVAKFLSCDYFELNTSTTYQLYKILDKAIKIKG